MLLTGDDNVVQGTMIGTNAAGDAAIDSTTGVYVRGDDNLVGGVLAGEGNVVSGHRGEGVDLRADPVTASPAQRNRVEGDLIGTDVTGTLPLPNGGDGMELVDASDTAIGGTVAGAGDVAAANEDDGVRIRTDDTAAGDGTAIVGNAIGTNAAGADLGNAVARTGIFGNGGLGIDLEGDGATANDPPVALDADVGANGLQNLPVLDAATTGVGGTTVDWTIDGPSLTQMRVELCANTTCTAPTRPRARRPSAPWSTSPTPSGTRRAARGRWRARRSASTSPPRRACATRRASTRPPRSRPAWGRVAAGAQRRPRPGAGTGPPCGGD